MSTNHAAYLKEKTEPLSVSEAPFPQAGKDQIVVKTVAVAINPIDHMQQDHGFFINSYPHILGGDVAGTVESIGEGVSGFSKGDRVFAHCLTLVTGKTEHSAFQEYVLVNLPLVAKIPENVSFEEAAVLPLCIDTAADGLFNPEKLALPLPPTVSGKGKTILVWGGSGSVGSNAIQLAVATGYEVFATASARNHDFVSKLGATKVFDYNSPSLVEDVVAALKGKDVVGGYDAISQESTIKTFCEILDKAGAAKRLVVVLPGSESHATHDVTAYGAFAPTVKDNEVGSKLWAWLSQALTDGTVKAAPKPHVVGKGLSSIQTGIDTLRKGVSGQKLVVVL